MRQQNHVLKLTLSALFLAMAYVLPFLTGQIPEIGAMLCPLHIPALLCGFICGGPWGLAVGFIAPLFRSMILGMPPMFPGAVCMAFEMAVYGVVVGFLYRKLPQKKSSIYVSLITAMILGRIVWGLAMMVCMGISGGAFTSGAFIAGAITNAIPGIAVQLILIPILVMALEKANVVDMR